MEIALVLMGIAAFVVGIIAFARWNERRRTSQLQQQAEELGLDFRPAGDEQLRERLGGFRLFQQGRSRKLRNLVVGDAGEFNISIFDYQYTTGGGNHQVTVVQTVALLESEDLQIPPFSLRPESMFDKLGGALGLQKDINFPEHPDFSKMFLLQSADETGVRELFHSDLIGLLQDHKGISIEAVPGLVIIYNSRQRRKPMQLKQFFGEALEIMNALTVDMPADTNRGPSR